MPTVVGSIRKLTLNGTSFDVPGDVNIEEVGGLFEKTAIPTSGDNAVKFAKRAKMREGINITASAVEKQLLEELADSGAWYPCSYTDASAVTRSSTCQIEFVKGDTQEGKCEIKLIPLDNRWV